MEAGFWHQKWERGETGFHRADVNPFLVAHFDRLNLPEGARVFLPLCGKTHDIAWLLERGYRIAGAELSALAIGELFKSLGLVPEIVSIESIDHYSAENIDIYVGDIFHLSASTLGPVDVIYDRAALVALPDLTRQKYTAHIMQLTSVAPQLLITYEYDQSQITGPPFSVSEEEVRQHYAKHYDVEPVERLHIEGGFKEKVDASETVWLLKYRPCIPKKKNSYTST